jgi:predicted secreted protein
MQRLFLCLAVLALFVAQGATAQISPVRHKSEHSVRAVDPAAVAKQVPPKLTSGDVIHVTAKRPSFNISLKANPSTGYRWYVNDYDSKMLEVINQKFVPSDTHMMGAGGVTTWRFHVFRHAFKARHKLKLELLYARSWEFNKGTKKVFYIVTGPK